MNMRMLLSIVALLAGLMALAPSGASAQGTHMFAVLVGGNETPNPGDPNGYGSATVTFRGAGLTEVCVTIFVTGITPATAAHIHTGFGQTAGPIFLALPTPAANGFSSGCVTATVAQSQQLRANKYGFYINVHAVAPFTTGALRGQLF